MSTDLVKAAPQAMSPLPPPEELREAWRLAEAFLKTGFLPKSVDTPAKCVAIYLKGRELGLPFMMAMGSIHIIEGKPACSSELLRSLCLQRVKGFKIEPLTLDNSRCRIRFSRDGSEPFEYEYSLADAERASLTSKQVWKANPKPMLFARCSSQGIRFYAPDGAMGLYAVEEFDSYFEGREERPISLVSAPSPKVEAAKAAAETAEAALSSPAPAPEAEVVEEPAKAAEPEPADYVAEAKKIMQKIYEVIDPKTGKNVGVRFDTRGGPERWHKLREELVTWGTRNGLAPAVIDDRAVYGFALAYREHKAKQREDAKAGDAATESAAGTEPAPAAEKVDGNVDPDSTGGTGEAGAAEAALPSTESHAAAWPALVEALRVVGKKAGRELVVQWEGRWWLTAGDFLDAIGCSESVCLEAPESEQFFEMVREKMRALNAALDAKRPRGPATSAKQPVL